MTIIFVHVPKAAGSSLRLAISARVGDERIFIDNNQPMAKAGWHRKSLCLIASCYARQPREPVIFGHFLAGKYARFTGSGFVKRPGNRYAIVLREPLQRAISHYYYWKRTDLPGHRIWERCMRENWSLERFLLGPEHINFQSRFVWRFPMEQFDFVGLADRFQDSLKLLGEIFPEFKELDFLWANANEEPARDSLYSIDANLDQEFKRLNRLDYSVYHRAEEIFSAKNARYLGSCGSA
ncbi:MAG: sulfotransferase family 2 domain-containing protein [Gammaproteobacteria bacterium]